MSSRTCIVQILMWLQVQLNSEVGHKQTTGPDVILAGLVVDWGIGGSHQCFCMARKFQPISRGALSCQSQSAFRKQNQAIATRIRPDGMHSCSRWGLMTSKESPHRPLCCYLTEDAETPAVIPPTEPAEPHSRPIFPQVMTLMYSSTDSQLLFFTGCSDFYMQLRRCHSPFCWIMILKWLSWTGNDVYFAALIYDIYTYVADSVQRWALD